MLYYSHVKSGSGKQKVMKQLDFPEGGESARREGEGENKGGKELDMMMQSIKERISVCLI